MERNRKMDLAGPASTGSALVRLAILLLLCATVQAYAQNSSPSLNESFDLLIKQEKWQEVVDLARSTPMRSAEVEYFYGTALAHLQRWQEAHKAFQAGSRLQPSDERFPLELAGVDFKQKKYPDAARHLRQAIRLAPDDSYANEFLATVYFLEENVDAALKYWNRVGKPTIAHVRSEPKPRVDPALLDHAFAFAPASVLRLPDFLTSQSRVKGLDIFSSATFELQARDEGQFDLVMQNHELNGFGNTKLEKLVRLFRGLPGQSVHPEFYNFHGKAINFVSWYRWDAQKRRVRAEVSGPLRENPKRRVAFGVDLRGENWNIRRSFTGPAPILAGFNMRREAINASFNAFQSGRWRWSAGVELSHRDFRDVFLATTLTPEPLSKGYQLKQLATLNAEIWRIPEHRINISGSVSSDAGRIWSEPSQAFEKLQGMLRFHWYPQAMADDYEILHVVRAGKTWGNVPFDEFYTLGVLGDNNLIMRAHITTRDGRKGAAPLGRNYFLSNWELDKNVYRKGWFNVKVGPFLDTGKSTDSVSELGSHQWLWDTGGQIKARAFGISFGLTYGKDLRAGKNAVFVTVMK